MIQIKDVTKLYPAKEAGKDRQGQPLDSRARSHLSARDGGRVALDHGSVRLGQIARWSI